MRISLHHLRSYCPRLSRDPAEVRRLLDDVGIEVKRLDEAGGDTFLTLELLANRGDHRSYAGVAREVVARLGGPLQLPEAAELVTDETDFPISVETKDCLIYTATPLEISLGGGPLPSSVSAPLLAAGLQPVIASVDATNLVNLELGQPTHCFDAEAIRGGITVRFSRPGERAWLLFQPEPLTLPAETLVVADLEKILAVAGVIGCEESKVTAASRRLILESAAFDPVAVRRASRALRVQTDASARFERGADPSLALGGAARVVYLLETYAPARRLGPTTVAGAWRDPRRTIDLDLDRLEAFFGRPFSPAECRERLTPYGFRLDDPDRGRQVRIAVPPARLWDVEGPEDIYEEIARSVGYNELPEHLPPSSLGALPSAAERSREVMDAVLLGKGFYEVTTDGFYSRKVRTDLCGGDETHPLWPHIEIENALDSTFALLKNNGLAQALEAVDANLRYNTETVKIFEWTRTFHPNPAPPNGACDERRKLWLIACGNAREATWAEDPRPVDVWFLKGIVEELAVELRLPLRILAADPGHPLGRCLHPYRQASIGLQGRVVGILGEVEGRILRAFGIKRARPYYLDFDVDLLRAVETFQSPALPPSRPPSVRMLAFTLPERVPAGEVQSCLAENAPDWLQRASIVDSYDHEENGRPVRTITYAVEYRNDQAEHSSDEINETTQELTRTVERLLGDRGVRLRTQ